jgi:hypothetical protein
VAAQVKNDLGFDVRLVDGGKGEFSVLVDDVPLIQWDHTSLPSVEEVEAAILNAVPQGV